MTTGPYDPLSKGGVKYMGTIKSEFKKNSPQINALLWKGYCIVGASLRIQFAEKEQKHKDVEKISIPYYTSSHLAFVHADSMISSPTFLGD